MTSFPYHPLQAIPSIELFFRLKRIKIVFCTSRSRAFLLVRLFRLINRKKKWMYKLVFEALWMELLTSLLLGLRIENLTAACLCDIGGATSPGVILTIYFYAIYVWVDSVALLLCNLCISWFSMLHGFADAGIVSRHHWKNIEMFCINLSKIKALTILERRSNIVTNYSILP